jgi:hypothetical protein
MSYKKVMLGMAVAFSRSRKIHFLQSYKLNMHLSLLPTLLADFLYSETPHCLISSLEYSDYTYTGKILVRGGERG